MSKKEPPSIARRFAAGDAAATEEVRIRVRRIVAFRGYGIPHQERVDLEQSVVVELWRAVARPGFDEGRFWGLVEVVAARRAIDWWRASRVAPTLGSAAELRDPGAGPLARVLSRERAKQAEAALADLPAGCRELIDLHFFQRKPYSEIAAILGKSAGSLRVQMHRCIRKASQKLRRSGGRTGPAGKKM